MAGKVCKAATSKTPCVSPAPSRMPCYKVLCLAKPESSPQKLANIFKGVARVVYQEKGQFRQLENLGVRPLMWPYRKHGAKFNEARWVQFSCDVNPIGLRQVQNWLRQEDTVLMSTPLRVRTAEPGGIVGDFKPHRRAVEKKKYTLPPTPSSIPDLMTS